MSKMIYEAWNKKLQGFLGQIKVYTDCYNVLIMCCLLSGSYSGGEDGLAQRASQNPD